VNSVAGPGTQEVLGMPLVNVERLDNVEIQPVHEGGKLRLLSGACDD